MNPSTIYAKDAKGTTCLHIAIMRGHKHIVDFLLKKTRAYVEVDANPKLNPKEKQKFEDVQKALLRKTNLAIQWEDQVEIDE